MEQQQTPKKKTIGKKIVAAILFVFWIVMVICGFIVTPVALIWRTALEIADNVHDWMDKFLE